MTDIAVKFENFGFDIAYDLGDFETDEGLETAVNISLWTDRRISKEELPEDELDKRGWWGDLFSDYSADFIGSRLWLLGRSKISEETRNQVEEYTAEALKWFIEDGIAESIEVIAEIDTLSRERISVEAKITRPRTRDVYFYRFQLLWDAQTLKARRVY